MIWSLAASLARQLPGEAAHRLAVACLARGIAPRRDASPDAGLVTAFAGMQLPNPLGLAAGFDKNAEAMAGAHRIGFGFAEVGTITPLPQPGNDKPRVFRLSEDRAVINRYGFNNDGMVSAASRLDRFRASAVGRVLSVSISVPTRTVPTALLIIRKRPPDWPGTQITSLSMYHRLTPPACAACNSVMS